MKKTTGTLESLSVKIDSDEPAVAVVDGESVSIPRDAVQLLAAQIGEEVEIRDDGTVKVKLASGVSMPWTVFAIAAAVIVGMLTGYDCRGCGDCRAPVQVQTR